MADNKRMSRVDSEIQKNLAKIISQFDDEEISTALISIMKVETYADFSYSKIYVSVFGDEEKKNHLVAKLNDNKVTIRYKLAHSMRFRTVPDLIFKVYEEDKQAERVLKLFEQIESELKNSDKPNEDTTNDTDE